MPLKPQVITQKASEHYATNPKFIKLEAISLKNCLEGTGPMERTTLKKMLQQEGGDKFKFGKYKGETYKSVKNKDPGYFYWCEENIKGFSNQVEPYL